MKNIVFVGRDDVVGFDNIQWKKSTNEAHDLLNDFLSYLQLTFPSVAHKRRWSRNLQPHENRSSSLVKLPDGTVLAPQNPVGADRQRMSAEVRREGDQSVPHASCTARCLRTAKEAPQRSHTKA